MRGDDVKIMVITGKDTYRADCDSIKERTARGEKHD